VERTGKIVPVEECNGVFLIASWNGERSRWVSSDVLVADGKSPVVLATTLFGLLQQGVRSYDSYEEAVRRVERMNAHKQIKA